MPLKDCRECGQRVSTAAATCPTCGTPDPTGAVAARKKKESADAAKIAFGGCGILLLMFVGFCSYVANDIERGAQNTPPPVPDLRAGARLTATQIHVTNNDRHAWTDCIVELNPGLIRSGFAQQVGRIGAGETVTGGLMAFIKPDGERFNPGAYAVQSVAVRCSTPRGQAGWMGHFD
jgi:hypothetical protein